MRSIRTRLLLALLALVAAVSVLAGVLTYRRVLAETSDLLDYQLRQMALSLENQIPLAPRRLPESGADYIIEIWNLFGVIENPQTSRLLEANGHKPTSQETALRGIADALTVYEIP